VDEAQLVLRFLLISFRPTDREDLLIPSNWLMIYQYLPIQKEFSINAEVTSIFTPMLQFAAPIKAPCRKRVMT
jgi:hypothetical protein